MSGDSEQYDMVVAVLTAFLKDAHYLADLTSDFIHKSGLTDEYWTSSALLDIGAIARIRSWEEAGIKDAIDRHLPTSAEALERVLQSLRAPKRSSQDPRSPLLSRVVVAWWFGCAHPEQQHLRTDFAIGDADRSKIVAMVAQLLWKYRNIH